MNTNIPTLIPRHSRIPTLALTPLHSLADVTIHTFFSSVHFKIHSHTRAHRNPHSGMPKYANCLASGKSAPIISYRCQLQTLLSDAALITSCYYCYCCCFISLLLSIVEICCKAPTDNKAPKSCNKANNKGAMALRTVARLRDGDIEKE